LDKLPQYVTDIREHLDNVAAPGTSIDASVDGAAPGRLLF
jgi:hypothetical protein